MEPAPEAAPSVGEPAQVPVNQKPPSMLSSVRLSEGSSEKILQVHRNKIIYPVTHPHSKIVIKRVQVCGFNIKTPEGIPLVHYIRLRS